MQLELQMVYEDTSSKFYSINQLGFYSSDEDSIDTPAKRKFWTNEVRQRLLTASGR